MILSGTGIFASSNTDRLLDVYPGAEAAYSLRLLNSSYTGPCIRVRRANQGTEEDINFIDGYCDISRIIELGLGGTTDMQVAKWYDQSGNGNDLNNTVASEQPDIYQIGSGMIESNGKSAIYFNGSGGQTSTDRFWLRSPNTIDVTQDLSMFAVMAPVNPQSQDGTWAQISSISNSNDDYMAYGFRDGGYFTRYRTTSTTILNGLDTSNSNQSLVSDIVDWVGVSNDFKVSGVVGTDLNDGRSTNTGTNPLILGTRADTAYSTKMYFQEWVIYLGDKTAVRSNIEANINDYYKTY